MADFRFENIHLVLGEPNPHIREGLKAALFANGFRGITDCHSIERLVDVLDNPSVDVVLCDVDLPGGSFCDLVHRMRHNTLGRNPFVLTLATTGDPNLAMVRQVIDAGVDDLLVKPLAMDVLLERIGNFARGRKPFVVTHDYIGPDRRKDPRPGEPPKTELIEVPNPLRSKVVGGTDLVNLQRMIDNATVRLNEHKMERYSVQVGFLVTRIVAFYDGAGSIEELVGDLDRLLFIGEDLSRRLRGTNYAHVAELALSLTALVGRIQDLPATPDHVDIGLLGKLAQAIRRAFSADQQGAVTAQAISDTLSEFAALHKSLPAAPDDGPLGD
ncbi:MAG TPA: response regulator [Patescibacteria group bacterium]|nr:response regulator [Patescibacteria group bacterium]